VGVGEFGKAGVGSRKFWKGRTFYLRLRTPGSEEKGWNEDMYWNLDYISQHIWIPPRFNLNTPTEANFKNPFSRLSP